MLLTTRDMEIIEFLEEFKIASTSTLAKRFFPSLSAAHKRLKTLTDGKVLKRSRDIITAEYVYYVTKPKQIRHALLVTDFYRELSKRVEVVKFKIEPSLGHLVPDAVFGYMRFGDGFIGLLEVEISNKGLDLLKYEKFYAGDYKEYYPVKPKLFVVTDKPKTNSLGINYIDTRFKKFVL